MVCLAGAVLERRTLWHQVPLTELAEEIAQEARSLEVEVDWRRTSDRTALLDGIAWLAGLGVLTLRFGAEDRFGESVDEATEAYYDIDRARLAGVLADPILVAGAHDVADLDPASATISEPGRVRAQRLTRRLVEDPALYLEDLSEADRQYFLGQRGPLERRAAELTGLQVERRREGSALVAVGRELSDRPFPARSHRKQLALLLLSELCAMDTDVRGNDTEDERNAPMTISGSRVQRKVAALLKRHRDHWGLGADSPSDITDISRRALTLLEELMLVRQVEDGVEVRPAAFRYRDTVAKVPEQPSLFGEADGGDVDD
jgi:uncharacterized protein (TIGR02678 family)